MRENNIWPRALVRKEKKSVAKGQEKAKKRERGRRPKKNEIKAQSANVCQRHKSKKMMRSTKCLKKKRVICSMLD